MDQTERSPFCVQVRIAPTARRSPLVAVHRHNPAANPNVPGVFRSVGALKTYSTILKGELRWCRRRSDQIPFIIWRHPHTSGPAAGLYGADLAAISALSPKLPNVGRDLPAPGDFRLVNSRGRLGATQALFIGTPSLRYFRYGEIRSFGRSVLEVLTKIVPQTRRLAMTVHGAAFGLDELECFEASIAGLLDGIASGAFPPELSDIAILETVERRAERFDQEVDRLVKTRILEFDPSCVLQVQFEAAAAERFRSVGYASDVKPLLFVAIALPRRYEGSL